MLGWNAIVTAILLEGMYVESCRQYKVAARTPLTKQEFINSVMFLGVAPLTKTDAEMKRAEAFLEHMAAFFEPRRRTH